MKQTPDCRQAGALIQFIDTSSKVSFRPRIDDFQPPPRGRVELLVEEKTSTIVVLQGKRSVS